MSKLLKTINDKQHTTYVPELIEAKKEREPAQQYASNVRKEREMRKELWTILANKAVDLYADDMPLVRALVKSKGAAHGWENQWVSRGWPKDNAKAVEDFKKKDDLIAMWNKVREETSKSDEYGRDEIVPGLHLEINTDKPSEKNSNHNAMAKALNIPIRAIQRFWKINIFVESHYSLRSEREADVKAMNTTLQKGLNSIVQQFITAKFGPLAKVAFASAKKEYEQHGVYQGRHGTFVATVALLETKGFSSRGNIDISRFHTEIVNTAKLAHTTPQEILDAIVAELKKEGALKVAENTVKEHLEALKRDPYAKHTRLLNLRETTLSLLESSEHEQSL